MANVNTDRFKRPRIEASEFDTKRLKSGQAPDNIPLSSSGIPIGSDIFTEKNDVIDDFLQGANLSDKHLYIPQNIIG